LTDTPWKLRLSRILDEHREQHRGYSQLAKAITEAYPGTPRVQKKGREKGESREVVDRRKLQEIVEGKPGLKLSVADLAAIDCYLEAFGEGLSYRPLFDKPDILQAIADSGRVTFLLGTQGEEEGGNFPHWDVLAMAGAQRSLTAWKVGMQLDVQDVPMKFARSDWTEDRGWGALFGPRGPSLVVLGSNRTMPASEVMLCKMFGGEPFEDQALAETRALPFRFAWNPELENVLPSRFRIAPVDLESRNAQAAERVRKGRGSALVLSDQVFVDSVTKQGWGDVYGLCVAQRRENGAVWLLLAGLSGPCTLAAAQIARSLPIRFGEDTGGGHSPVYWTVVTGHIPESHKRNNRILRSFDETIVTGPHVWPPIR
jgi:hypothetical protein